MPKTVYLILTLSHAVFAALSPKVCPYQKLGAFGGGEREGKEIRETEASPSGSQKASDSQVTGQVFHCSPR